jgi:hypothetical protein
MLLVGSLPARADEMLHLFAAGSLTGAMKALLAESGVPANRIAPSVFGPSDLLRYGIEVSRQPILAFLSLNAKRDSIERTADP